MLGKIIKKKPTMVKLKMTLEKMLIFLKLLAAECKFQLKVLVYFWHFAQLNKHLQEQKTQIVQQNIWKCLRKIQDNRIFLF